MLFDRKGLTLFLLPYCLGNALHLRANALKREGSVVKICQLFFDQAFVQDTVYSFNTVGCRVLENFSIFQLGRTSMFELSRVIKILAQKIAQKLWSSYFLF